MKTKAPKHTKIGLSIIAGLREAVAHHRGELELRTTTITVPASVDVKAVREKLGLSQSQFAAQYGFNPRTIQEWEQGRAKPDSPVRAYLAVIASNPQAVEQALRESA